MQKKFQWAQWQILTFWKKRNGEKVFEKNFEIESLCYKKIQNRSFVVHDMRNLKKKCFWVRKRKISAHHRNLKKIEQKKYCVLVCFFCMTVKMKIFAAPLRKMDWKKLIIKCLIFLPTLNYCISLSMNENSLCYENPPPLKKVPDKKRFERNRSKFFQTWVSLHFHLEMNTDSLGTWNKILEKLSIRCPPFF